MTDEEWQQLIAGAVAAKDPSQSAQDAPLIPLWQTRPVSPVKVAGGGSSAGGAGSANAAEHAAADAKKPIAGNANPIWVTGAADPAESYSTMAAAEGHWMDMTTEERLAFADAAQKAGVWKRSLGPDALFGAWAKAVGWAGKYNNLHSDDRSKWLSPFEAVSNMAIAGMADDNQSHDGFSTESSVKQYATHDLLLQAKQVLQQELGRNPTDSEMKAYTAAVNAASRANPAITQSQETLNPDGSKSYASVKTGGFDDSAAAGLIQDMAQNTQESDAYKSAAVYLPALEQAVGAAFQLG